MKANSVMAKEMPGLNARWSGMKDNEPGETLQFTDHCERQEYEKTSEHRGLNKEQ